MTARSARDLDAETLPQIELNVPLPFEATHIDIIGYIDIGNIDTD